MFCDACIGVLQHRHHIISMTRLGDTEYDVDRGPSYTVSMLNEATHTRFK
jgi:hypothetical protein